ncbi:autotransporter outer membrane beta-barrel domain-containing protein [Celeribacter sp.]|uniref:autotransporter outer membrane beta-barrel domain-containing protein n=1 Tax=Celeribacter sp. TaxID=1890673 RepID=UPI003A8E308C
MSNILAQTRTLAHTQRGASFALRTSVSTLTLSLLIALLPDATRAQSLSPAEWTGAVDADWQEVGNWADGTLPDGTQEVNLGSGDISLSGGSGTGTYINVGTEGAADLTIDDDALFEVECFAIGNTVGETSSLTISGSGTVVDALNALGVGFRVGETGDGTLTISDGATVLNGGALQIGYGADTSGTLTITGDGTSVSVGRINIGQNGQGTMLVDDGALVDLNESDLYVTAAEGSDGSSLTISGGAQMINVDDADIGRSSDGTLTLSDGGSLSMAGSLRVGSDTSAGSVVVTGAGSTLETDGSITLTAGSFGTFDILDGASVSSNTFSLGSGLYGGEGAVLTVSGEGSTLETVNGLSIGTYGEGVLNLSYGGTVSAGTGGGDNAYLLLSSDEFGEGVVNIGAVEGEAAIEAGSLAGTENIRFGEGTSQFVLNHTDTGLEIDADFVTAFEETGTAMIKQIAGTTIFNGNGLEYNGAIEVSGGTALFTDSFGGAISVSDGGTLGGTGSLGYTEIIITTTYFDFDTYEMVTETEITQEYYTATIGSGGTLAPGLTNEIGALNFAGDLVFEDGSTFLVDMGENGVSDQVTVDGAITIDAGAQIAAVVQSGISYLEGWEYTVLSGESLAGTFADISETGDYATFTATYSDTDLTLTIGEAVDPGDDPDDGSGSGDDDTPTGPDFTATAQTANQVAVGTAINAMSESSDLYNTLYLVQSGGTAEALDQLSGDILATTRSAMISDGTLMRDAMGARLLALETSREQGDFVSQGGGFQEPYRTNRLTPWAATYGAWSDLDGDGEAQDVERMAHGLVMGLDGTGFDDWNIGLMAGFGYASYDSERSDVSSDSYHLGAYAGKNWGAWTLRSGISWSQNDLRSSRSVEIAQISGTSYTDTLTGSYEAKTMQAFGEVGYGFERGNTRFEPFANLALMRLETDGFTETGGAAALTVEGDTSKTTFTTLGLRADHALALGVGSARLSGTLGWQHVFGDTDFTSVHSFVDSDSFTVTGAPLERDSAIVKAGVDVQLSPGSVLGLSYEGAFQSGFASHGLGARLDLQF